MKAVKWSFISLRRFEPARCDADGQRPQERPHQKINATKTRLQKEFDSGPGHAWITEGREIEKLRALRLHHSSDCCCASEKPRPAGNQASMITVVDEERTR